MGFFQKTKQLYTQYIAIAFKTVQNDYTIVKTPRIAFSLETTCHESNTDIVK